MTGLVSSRRLPGALGQAEIGILSVIQPETHLAGTAVLVLMIHDALFGAMAAAVARISALDCVKAPPALLHVESFPSACLMRK